MERKEERKEGIGEGRKKEKKRKKNNQTKRQSINQTSLSFEFEWGFYAQSASEAIFRTRTNKRQSVTFLNST